MITLDTKQDPTSMIGYFQNLSELGTHTQMPKIIGKLSGNNDSWESQEWLLECLLLLPFTKVCHTQKIEAACIFANTIKPPFCRQKGTINQVFELRRLYKGKLFLDHKRGITASERVSVESFTAHKYKNTI